MDDLQDTPAVRSQDQQMPASGERKAPPAATFSFVHTMPHDDPIGLDHVTVGILTALPHEHAAARQVFGYSTQCTGHTTGTTYHLARVFGRQGDGIVVAIVVLSRMGTNPAATMVANMINDCKNIKDVIVCGIAGAMPAPQNAEDHVRLGDVVMSTEGVLQYDLGKQHGDNFRPTPQIYQPSTRLVDAARQLRSNETIGLRPWDKHIDDALQALPKDFQRPDPTTDVLCEPDRKNWRQIFRDTPKAIKGWLGLGVSYPPIPHPIDQARNPNYPRIFDGLAGSANCVLKSWRFREKLRKQYPKLRAVEMEGVGAAESCRAAGSIGSFMVRGTCDYCNERKNDSWQKYAAVTAAALTKALLEVTDPSIWRTQAKVLTKIFPPGAGAEISIGTQFMDAAISEAGVGANVSGTSATGFANQTSSSSVTNDFLQLSAPVIGEAVSARAVFVQIPDAQLRMPIASRTSSGGDELIKEMSPEVEQQSPALHFMTGGSERLLADDVERRCAEIEYLLERWEISAVYKAAPGLVLWLSTYEAMLPADSLSRSYGLLARVELTRLGSQGTHDTKAMDLARQYLSKARDATNR